MMKFLTWAYWKMTGDVKQMVEEAYAEGFHDGVQKGFHEGFRDGVINTDADYQPLIDQLTVATKRMNEMDQKLTAVNSLLDAFKGTRPT